MKNMKQIDKKQWNMMKNSGKNTETWWTIEEKTMKHDEQERKKTRKNDEKEWKKQWNIMKNREQQWKMVKNRETMNNRGLEAGWLDE